MTHEEFDGVFRFTNATAEDFKVLWNNKEYVFPAGTSCPMIIPNETPENVQEIRKKFAYKLAVREFHNSKEYRDMVKIGRDTPSTYDDKVLENWIQQCLTPLPIASARAKELLKDNEKNYRGTKALSSKDNPNEMFKDEPVMELGKMGE